MEKLDERACEPLNKPSAMVSMHMDKALTLTQYKHYNALLFFAKNSLRKNPNDSKFNIKLSELKALAGDKSTQNQKARESLEELMRIKCEYNVLGKDGEIKEENKFILLAGITVKHGTGIVEYSFPHQVLDILKNNIYAQLDLGIIRKLRSKYSIKLYEICKDYEKAPTIPVIDIAKFKKIFNCETYSQIVHLRDFVLNPAVNEINGNKYIPFMVTYQLNKTGREYQSVKFAISNKDRRSDENESDALNAKSDNSDNRGDPVSSNEKPQRECNKQNIAAEPLLFDLEIDSKQNGKKAEENKLYFDFEKESIEILDYLNQKTGKNFNVKNQNNLKNIRARIKDGHTIEQLKSVIDKKCDEWLNDKKMNEFLNPETLFRPSHFEKYLFAGAKSGSIYASPQIQGKYAGITKMVINNINE